MLLANQMQFSQKDKTMEKYGRNINKEVREGWKDNRKKKYWTV